MTLALLFSMTGLPELTIMDLSFAFDNFGNFSLFELSMLFRLGDLNAPLNYWMLDTLKFLPFVY